MEEILFVNAEVAEMLRQTDFKHGNLWYGVYEWNEGKNKYELSVDDYGYEIFEAPNIHLTKDTIGAPLLCEVTNWLREQYKIEIVLTPYMEGNDLLYAIDVYYYYQEYKDYDIVNANNISKDSYASTLNEGIKIALEFLQERGKYCYDGEEDPEIEDYFLGYKHEEGE